MILVDAKLLLYACDEPSAHHAALRLTESGELHDGSQGFIKGPDYVAG